MRNLYYTLCLLFFVLTSCIAIKQIRNRGENTKTGKQSFEIKNNAIILDTKLDGTSYQWMFDTGSTFSVISDTIGLKNKKIGKLPIGGAKLPDGSKLKTRFVTGDIENDFLSIEHQVFTMIPQTEPEECKETPYTRKGIIGSDIFFIDGALAELNFDENQISILSETDFDNRIKDGYSPIEASFKHGHVYLPIKAGGKTYEFLMDTGFTESIMLPFEDQENIKYYNSMEMEGSVYKTIKGFVPNDRVIYSENVDVVFAGIPMKTLTASSLQAKNLKNVGIKFIKNFNWLIDYGSKKVYIKPVAKQPESPKLPEISYKIKAINDKIIILARNIKNTEYPVNSEITSVNDVLVNKENKCQILKQLNDTKDWKTLKIEIKKPN